MLAKLETDFKSVFFILLVGSVLGLLINYLNPNGLPWIKEERKIAWADDSLNATSEILNSESTNEQKIESGEPVAITLKQAYKLYNEKVVFVDARDFVEYEISHIKGAISLPYYDFDKYKSVLDTIPLQTPLVAYCDGKECDLSILLSDKLYEAGYGEVYIFFGGWVDWQDKNYPVDSNE